MSTTSKAIILISVGTLCSNFLGFSRELILAYKYGTGSVSDMYLVASIIPGTIFIAFAAALTIVYIPLVSEMTGNDKKISIFTSNLINILGFLTLIILVIFLLLAKPIVQIFAIGFNEAMVNQTVQLTRIMFPLVLSLIFYNVFQGYLHIKGKFFSTSLIGIPLNIFIILGILFSSSKQIWIMGLGNLMGYIGVFLFLLYFVLKSGFKYSMVFNFKDPGLKKILALSVPIFIGISVNQINTIIDRSIASTLEEGVISALNFSARLIYFINGIFVVSVVTVLFPKLSRLNVSKDLMAFKRILSSSIILINLLVFPISIGAIVLSEPIVQILFERGAFDSRATEYTSISLTFYAIGIVGIGVREFLVKVFYSIQDTKSPMINAAIAVFLNVVLNLILVNYLGYIGLPLSTSIASIVTVILLGFTLRNKIGSFGIRKICLETMKILIASLLMGITVFVIYRLVNSFTITRYILGDLFNIIVTIICGSFIYFYLLILMKVKEIKDIIEIIKVNKK